MFKELVDTGGVILGAVQGKVEIGYATQLQAFKDFVADEADGVFESLDGAFLFFLGTAGGYENAGVAAVGRQADFIDDHRNLEPWIFEFAGQHGVDLMGDFFADAFVTMVRSGHGSAIVFYSIAARSTSRPGRQRYNSSTE